MVDSCSSQIECEQSSTLTEERREMIDVDIFPLKLEGVDESKPSSSPLLREGNEKNIVELDLAPINSLLIEQAGSLRDNIILHIKRLEYARNKLIEEIDNSSKSLSSKEVELPSRISVSDLNELLPDTSLRDNIMAIYEYREKVQTVLSSEVDHLKRMPVIEHQSDHSTDLVTSVDNLHESFDQLDSLVDQIEQSACRLQSFEEENDMSSWTLKIDSMRDAVLSKFEENNTIDCGLQVRMPLRRVFYVPDVLEIRILAGTAKSLIAETRCQFQEVLDLVKDEEYEFRETFCNVFKEYKELFLRYSMFKRIRSHYSDLT